MRNKKHLAALLSVGLWPLLGAEAADGTRLTVGSYFSSGDYGGSTTTEVQSLSLALRHRSGPWELKLSVPYLRITSDGSVLPDGEPTGASTTRSTRSGLGDVSVRLGRRLVYDKVNGYGLTARVKVKLPTANEDRALGSGEYDYTFELAPFKRFGDTTLYGALGYKVYGDTDTTDYNNVWLGRAGVMQRLDARQSLGISTSYRQKTTDTRDDKHNMMLFHTYKFDKTWRVQSFVIKGLSDATADLAGGISLTHQF